MKVKELLEKLENIYERLPDGELIDFQLNSSQDSYN